VLNGLVDFTFNNKNRNFLSVTKTANWVTGKVAVSKLYTAERVQTIVEKLIESSYFTVGNILFRQMIGIPMGSDPAPFFANLFIFHFECAWIKRTLTGDYGRVKQLNYTFRYIDDLIAINDNDEFEKSYEEIYPSALTLKKENINNSSATFLDMNISIINNKFDHKLYDKRDTYNFSIVRFPYKHSNIPSKMFFSSIGAETLRICRATSDYNNFLKSSSPFKHRMKNQGANATSINLILSRFMTRHWSEFKKYEKQKEQIIKDILNYT
jgi:RecG-like helicase